MHTGAATATRAGAPSRARQFAFLFALNAILFATAPLILGKKFSRYLRKRNLHEFDWKRWFQPPMTPGLPLAPLSGPRIVFVGPTFGELRLIEVITKRLKRLRPDINVIWSIRDRPTIEFAKQAHPDQAIVIWPFENGVPVLKWAARLRPDLVVIVEKFWMPNHLALSQLFGARVAVMNGRSNRKSRLTDRLKLPYYRWMAQNIDLLCTQAPLFVERVDHMLRPTTRTVVTGNMKLDLEIPPLDAERKAAIADWLRLRGGVPLLAAGSTGLRVDEEFVLAAFEAVRAETPCALLMAPRKLNRAPELVRSLIEAGYRVSRRTEPLEGPADVYVLDTLGELAHTYSHAEAAFIGGTIVGTGHNVIEPIVWGVPVSYGPERGHFEDLQHLCESFGVGFRCRTPEDLAAHWRRALTDQELRERVRENAHRLIERERGATDKTLNALLDLLREVES